MKNILTSLLLFFSCFSVFSQTFTVIEKNKSTAAIFDYNNPLSLVSLINNNANLFVENTSDQGQTLRIDAFTTSDLEKYNISKEELIKAETRGVDFQLYTGLGDDMTLIKTDEAFDSWYENLTHFVEDISLMPTKEFLKEMWDNTTVGYNLQSKEKRYFDTRDIDLVILQSEAEDTIVHFANKLKNYEKRVIVASISKRNLLDLMSYSVQVKAKKEVTKTAWEALRFKQLNAYESCLKEFYEEPNRIFEQFGYFNGLVKIDPIRESSIWERSLEFSTDLAPAKKMEYLHFGKLWECNQERPEKLEIFLSSGENVYVVKDRTPLFSDFLNFNYPEDVLGINSSGPEENQKLWEKTNIEDYVMLPLKTSYFWWDFDEPEMLIDYRFMETSETSGIILKPVTLYFVKDLPTINKKVITMRFDVQDTYSNMEFLPLLEMNPKVNDKELKWISALNNPVGQCFENTLKDREKLSSHLLLSDDFIKKGYRITLY